MPAPHIAVWGGLFFASEWRSVCVGRQLSMVKADLFVAEKCDPSTTDLATKVRPPLCRQCELRKAAFRTRWETKVAVVVIKVVAGPRR